MSLFQCVLSGLWKNELGSNMTISAVNADGGFTGSYHTAVTATDKHIRVSPLKGSQKPTSRRKEPTFGFTVSWTFSSTWPEGSVPGVEGNGGEFSANQADTLPRPVSAPSSALSAP